jgi:hypothetical protein
MQVILSADINARVANDFAPNARDEALAVLKLLDEELDRENNVFCVA